MAGNVMEWTKDWYDDSYYAVSPDSNPPGPATATYKSLRGGSWDFNADFLRGAFRTDFGAPHAHYAVGFRCVSPLGTGNDPHFPYNPRPVDEDVEQSVYENLRWSGGDPDVDIVTYDVYLESDDSTPDILVCDDVTATGCNPGRLITNTQYFWQVVATDPQNNQTESPVWEFTTSENILPPVDMALVPAGEFQMGCDLVHNGGYSCVSHELPLHAVQLGPYYIDIHEVTNAEYAQCVAAGACDPPNDDTSATRVLYYGTPTYDNYPVIHVDWNDATDYCTWSGKRLPTEAEWEKAARGTTARAFPWGDEAATCALANFDGDTACLYDTNGVGSYPDGAGPSGALDMAGNVWEWTNDWYDSDYYASSAYSNPTGPATGSYKVLRGGAWNSSDGWGLLTASRAYIFPTDSTDDLGFRCAVTPGN
jgi:formylglycine-generating enzyme required for sulfatase activity